MRSGEVIDSAESAASWTSKLGRRGRCAFVTRSFNRMNREPSNPRSAFETSITEHREQVIQCGRDPRIFGSELAKPRSRESMRAQ